eukprot:1565572-Rhodomonas_salina.2
MSNHIHRSLLGQSEVTVLKKLKEPAQITFENKDRKNKLAQERIIETPPSLLPLSTPYFPLQPLSFVSVGL